MSKTANSHFSENLEKLKKLSEETDFEGLRLMLTPNKITTFSEVVEDLCVYFEARKNGTLKLNTSFLL